MGTQGTVLVRIMGVREGSGCCGKRGTRTCCLITSVVGGLFLLIGLLLLAAGPALLLGVVLKTMALAPASDRLQSWLTPPVQPHLTGYAFHVTNPEAVLKGEKPVLQEVGPVVYKAITVKDSLDEESGNPNLNFNEDDETLTYRARKYYYIDREQSKIDPDTTYITVPNIPFLTGMAKIRDGSVVVKSIGETLMLNTGLGTPFINITFTGLLWGYDDDLPCNGQRRPEGCVDPEAMDIFADDTEGDDEWGDWKRKKRSTEEEEKVDMRKAHHGSKDKAKGEYKENCKCEWGLFRDRNMTLRKPVKIYHGVSDLAKKGKVVEFDGSPVMNWWKKDSKCDSLEGQQDSSTLPPGWQKTDSMDMFISLMCRSITLKFEKENSHASIPTLRFIPPPNAMGSHEDPDPERRNEDNSCFCMKEEGFQCLKSGVLNMAPCKVRPDLPTGAPLALSYPHFYQADPSYLDGVVGLSPDKEKHQFYVDVEPTFGFPLAIRPRFQLNIVMRKDEGIEALSEVADELVLPFLWAQDGFSDPSPEMAAAMIYGLGVPSKLSLLGGGFFLLIGSLLVGSFTVWVFLCGGKANLRRH